MVYLNDTILEGLGLFGCALLVLEHWQGFFIIIVVSYLISDTLVAKRCMKPRT
jgi:hypothetical protein